MLCKILCKIDRWIFITMAPHKNSIKLQGAIGLNEKWMQNKMEYNVKGKHVFEMFGVCLNECKINIGDYFSYSSSINGNQRQEVGDKLQWQRLATIMAKHYNKFENWPNPNTTTFN